jgi:hypothetical protein
MNIPLLGRLLLRMHVMLANILRPLKGGGLLPSPGKIPSRKNVLLLECLVPYVEINKWVLGHIDIPLKKGIGSDDRVG